MSDHLKALLEFAQARMDELKKDLDQTMANYNAIVGRQEEAKTFYEHIAGTIAKAQEKPEIKKIEVISKK